MTEQKAGNSILLVLLIPVGFLMCLAAAFWCNAAGHAWFFSHGPWMYLNYAGVLLFAIGAVTLVLEMRK